MSSERKAQAIYYAVHEALMPLRIENERRIMMSRELGRKLADAQAKAAHDAVMAYQRPLKPRKVKR